MSLLMLKRPFLRPQQMFKESKFIGVVAVGKAQHPKF